MPTLVTDTNVEAIPPVDISHLNLKPLLTAISELNTGVDLNLKDNVCLICDEFVNPNGLCHYISVDKLLDPVVKDFLLCSRHVEEESGGEIRFEPLPETVSKFYTYGGDDYGRPVTDEEKLDIQSMLLSPRGAYYKHRLKAKTGFLICKSCMYGVKYSKMPKYAIANNFYFGCPPACLTGLNDVELALLTPMRTYGYCFSFTGGAKRELSGSLTYYKIDVKDITNVAAQFDALGLQQNIVVMLHGNLTVSQAKRAYARSRICPQKLTTAVQWLIENHSSWKHLNYAETLRDLEAKPLSVEVLDRFKEDPDSEDSPARETEAKTTFDVFYPNGNAITSPDGSSSIAKFEAILKQAVNDGYALALRRNQSVGERTSEFNNNTLVDGCLLQFPYGLGGMRALRYKGNLSTGIMDVHDYVRHLMNVSQPHFHHDVFCLALYNIFVKHQMLLSASFNVRGHAAAEALMSNIDSRDIALAVEARQRGDFAAGTAVAKQYLNTIDAISRSIPHTDDAAKFARRRAKAHVHEFGLPTFFLTACPDDENSIVIQIMAQQEIVNDEPIGTGHLFQVF